MLTHSEGKGPVSGGPGPPLPARGHLSFLTPTLWRCRCGPSPKDHVHQAPRGRESTTVASESQDRSLKGLPEQMPQPTAWTADCRGGSPEPISREMGAEPSPAPQVALTLLQAGTQVRRLTLKPGHIPVTLSFLCPPGEPASASPSSPSSSHWLSPSAGPGTPGTSLPGCSSAPYSCPHCRRHRARAVCGHSSLPPAVETSTSSNWNLRPGPGQTIANEEGEGRGEGRSREVPARMSPHSTLEPPLPTPSSMLPRGRA